MSSPSFLKPQHKTPCPEQVGVELVQTVLVTVIKALAPINLKPARK